MSVISVNTLMSFSLSVVPVSTISTMTSLIPSIGASSIGRNAKRSFDVLAVTVFRGDGNSAFAHLEIEELVDVGSVFEKDILTHHADIRDSVLDVDRDVARLDEEITYPARGIFEYEFAVLFRYLVDIVTHFGKKLERFVGEPSFG